jgi:signal peptidase I
MMQANMLAMSIVERIPISKGKSSATSFRHGMLYGVIREAARTAAMTIVLLLFTLTFLAQGYQVLGTCMDPNIRTGERLLGSKFSYRVHPPVRGDIVVFTYPADKSQTYVKRVIGLPGEVVEIRHGSVLINGKPLNESYLVHPPHGDFHRSVVQPGRLFVMGDYRDCSNDSRYWGQLSISDIQAKAWLRYWPITRASVLR